MEKSCPGQNIFMPKNINSDEDMILVLGRQFKELSHEPENFQVHETIA